MDTNSNKTVTSAKMKRVMISAGILGSEIDRYVLFVLNEEIHFHRRCICNTRTTTHTYHNTTTNGYVPPSKKIK